MKHRFFICFAALAVLLTSCSIAEKDVPGMRLLDAVVTVKYEESRCFLQVEDDVRVYPTNLTKDIFGGKEVRALTKLALGGDERQLVDGQEVGVVWIDSILTKKTLPYSESADLGNDPITVIGDWLTVAEDGYLTLHIATSVTEIPHTVNLVSGSNPENPYELVFHHDAGGDLGGRPIDAVVAFNIKDVLSQAEGEVELTVRFDSYNGPQAFKLKTSVVPGK